MSDLTWMSAGELAAAIRERRVSAVEVLEAHLSQIARHNPALNAIVTLDEERARRSAEDADLAMARGEYRGPLHGVPITLKDCHATAGVRTTAGHPPLADYVPDHDGTVAARLKDAGAIVLGKTNVSTLLTDVQSNNAIFGRTNNPWGLDRTPGGSSGGAAAAVAAGLIPLEIGSDIGGSIRIPAHCCGIFGLKPTEHRVSNYGHMPDLPDHPRSTRVMNCIGPMARTLDDLDLAFRIIAGPDGRDLDVPPVPVIDVPAPDLRQLKLTWAPSFPGLPVQSDIGEALERTAVALREAGAAIEERLPAIDFGEQVEVRATLRRFVRVFLEPPEEPLSAADYFHALNRRDSFICAWEAFFDDHDALLCPVMMTTAFQHVPRDTSIPVDGQPHPYTLLPDYCRPFNLTGHPVVTLPIGFDGTGLPIGMQVVGKRWGDERLLGVARAINEVAGRLQQPPGY